MKLKRLASILMSICLLMGANCMISYASETDTSTIRVYDQSETNTRAATGERILLDTWTVGISADGSVNETNVKQARLEDAVAVTFKFYYDGINSNNEPQYTVTMTVTGETIIKKTKLQTKAQGVSTWASNTKNHSSYTAINSITYSYTSSNPPSNPYVYAKASVTIKDGTVYSIPQHKLTDAQ